MTSLAGIRLPTEAERAASRDSAQDDLDEIATAEDELVEFLALWLGKYEGDRSSVPAVADWLIDYFFDRRMVAADALSLQLDDTWHPATEKRLAELAKGSRR